MAVVNETAKHHGKSVALVHPGLGDRGVSGKGKGVGVVYDEAHVDTWVTLSLMTVFLIAEVFCRGKSNMISMSLSKLSSLKRALGPQILLCKFNASRALAKTHVIGYLNIRKVSVNVSEHG
jgi:hypothetical protein